MMKSNRSILYLFIIIISSTNIYAQSRVVSTVEINNEVVTSKPLFVLNETYKFQPLFANSNTSNSNLIKENDFDNSFKKYLGLTKADTRFNLNFTLVDPCGYPGTGDTNLSLIRNGYDPYYYNSNFRPNLFEDVICTVAKSFLSNLRR